MGPFGFRSGSVPNIGLRSGSIRAPFGIRSEQFRTKIFGAKNFENSNIFDFCGRRPRGGGPLAAVPSPAAAATAAQIQNF